MKYEIVESKNEKIIMRISDDGIISWVPMNEANSDYQAYLAHLTESVTKAK